MRNRTDSQRRSPRGAAGFTLVELLVVISVLGLLTAILLPSLSGARRISKRVACGTNLHSVGQAMRMYLNDSNDLLPLVESLPSTPFDEDNPRPSIAGTLRPYVQQGTDASSGDDEPAEVSNEVFNCPADRPGKDKRSGVNFGKSYFETEGSSYTFNIRLHFFSAENSRFFENRQLQPVTLTEVVRSERAKRIFGGQAPEESIWLMRDYIAFHGKPGTQGSTNYLYVDGRVADLER